MRGLASVKTPSEFISLRECPYSPDFLNANIAIIFKMTLLMSLKIQKKLVRSFFHCIFNLWQLVYIVEVRSRCIELDNEL